MPMPSYQLADLLAGVPYRLLAGTAQRRVQGDWVVIEARKPRG